MEKPVRILVLNNEIEALRIGEVLNDRNIPYILKTYRDTAYDGLWQTKTAWGHIEAPEQFRDEILKIYSELF